MAEKELKNLLEQFQASGQADSSGVFTLAVHKAQEKLSQFQLAQRQDYVKCLVASAVLSGATAMEIKIVASGSSTWWNGETYRPEQLETLLQQLLSPTDQALVELAVAVNSLRRAGEAVQSLSSVGQDGTGYKLRVQGESYALETVAGERPGTRFDLSHNLELGRLWSGWRGRYPEHSVLTESCCYAPLSLTVNDMIIQKPLRAGVSPDCIAWLQIGEVSGPDAPVEPSPEWARACLSLRQVTVDQQFGCVLALSPDRESHGEGLNLLLSGVHFVRGRHLLVTPFAHGFLWGPLDKNVSHSDLAENEKYHRLLEWGNTTADWLMLQRLESPIPLPQSYLPALIREAPKLAERFHRRKDGESAQRVQAWIAETQFFLDLKDENRWKALLRSLASLTDPDVIAARREKLGRALLQSLEMSVQSSNYSECQPLCEKLGALDPETYGEISRNLFVALAAVCGQESQNYEGLEPTLQANLLRLEGRWSEALDYLIAPLHRAQVFLALEQPEEARHLLREAGSESAESMETLSDCLAFAPKRTGEDGLEALELRRKAIALRELAGIPWGGLLQHDLARLARSVASLTTWIKYRAQASWAGGNPSEVAQRVEHQIESAIDKLQRKPTAVIQLQSALLHVEKLFPLDHLYLAAVRTKVVHALRRAERWQDADCVVARAWLLDYLLRTIRQSS